MALSIPTGRGSDAEGKGIVAGMVTQEDFDALKAGFLMLEELVRLAAYSATDGTSYNGPFVDVVDGYDSLTAIERETLTRAVAVAEA